MVRHLPLRGRGVTASMAASNPAGPGSTPGAPAIRGARHQFVIIDEIVDLVQEGYELICQECGNDLVCQGYLECSDCLEKLYP